jgi:uncharacterized protein YdeI (YjbR/CyaY-like superfamily)
MKTDYSKLERRLQKMPEGIRTVLDEHELTEAFYERPAYQQNDYLSWITRAKLEATRQKRLDQMVSELRTGGVYMKMDHPASAKKKT